MGARRGALWLVAVEARRHLGLGDFPVRYAVFARVVPGRVDCRRSLCLPVKTLPQLGGEQGFGPRHLDGHLPAQQRVLGQVDRTVTASPQFADDLEPADLGHSPIRPQG